MVDEICERLLRESNAVSVVLIDSNAHVLAHAGESVDLSEVWERYGGAFDGSETFAKGAKVHASLTRITDAVILIVLFDEQSSLGLVRLRVKKCHDDLARALTTPTLH